MNRANVNPECITAFNELKLDRKLKYIIFKLDDTNQEIVVEDKSEEGNWEEFRQKLIGAKMTVKGEESMAHRYAVYDVEYKLSNGEGTRNKITLIAWSPDDAGIKTRMVYAASKESLKNALNGFHHEIQANDSEDIEWETVLKGVSKGLA